MTPPEQSGLLMSHNLLQTASAYMSRLPLLSPSPLHGKFPLSIYFFQPIESRSRTCNHSRCCEYGLV